MSQLVILDGADETLTTDANGQATVNVDSSIDPNNIAGMLATPAQHCAMIQAQHTGLRAFTLTFYGTNGATKASTQVEFTWACVGVGA